MQAPTLPLEPLFLQLENAGFDLSPAAQQRAWQVLAGAGREAALYDPAALKWLLAPVFARSAEEQKRFYDLFDRYVEQVTTPQYEPTPLTWKEKGILFLQTHRKALWGILLAALLTVLGYFAWKYAPQPTPVQPEIPRPAFDIFKKEKGNWVKLDSVAIPEEKPKNDMVVGGETLKPLHEGDTLLLRNTIQFSPGQDSSAFQIEWEHALSLRRANKQSAPVKKGIVPAIIREQEWQTVVRFPEKNIETGDYSLKITPINHPEAARRITWTFYATCANPPRIPALLLPAKLRPGQNARVAIAGKPKKGLQYEWRISGIRGENNRVSGYGPQAAFTADSVESVQVRLTVTDTTQNGTCNADTTLSIPVGDTRVQLPYKTLEYDPVAPEKALNWASWLLLSLAALVAAWYWWRWWQRKAPESAPVRPDAPAAVETITTDRPPYYIPYRDAGQHLRPAREQYRLADALRLRQQSEDTTLDFPATLRATLDQGGYPALRYRTRTRPTEYLFMVDEQLPGHHQARLFRHLAETLRGQDVVMEMVWYDSDLRRCWGRDLPQGVSLDQLRRYFPQHRLVLLGNGHALLDEYADTPRLRPGLTQWLNAWPQRLLLTPQPPAAWNWREALLYAWFGVYPADLRGLLDAATFVEGGLDSTDLPPVFEAWKARQLALRTPEVNPDYQQWRTLEQHDAYLAPLGSTLRRWWMALAVHPDPEWEVTLAIGRALGIAPTHDRLLALSRIPALREGRLHPGLRRSMLLALPQEDETLARRAVLDELQAVQHLTEGSHVGSDTEAHIAVQAFLLDPQHPDRQMALAALLAAGALTRTQEDELNLFAAKAQPLRKGDSAPAKGDIRQWLDRYAPEPPEPEEQPRPPRPFYTPDFWKALTATAVLLLLCLGSWWMKQGEPRAFDPARDELRSTLWLRETWAVDSALLLHNRGVQAGTMGASMPNFPRADSLLTRAIALRGGAYPLAEHNLLRNRYNTGVFALADRRAPQPALVQAAGAFESAFTTSLGYPSDRLDALHGAGVAWFYANRRDSALLRYQSLLAAGYFDTLNLRPNLQALLADAGAVKAPTFALRVLVIEAGTGQPLLGVSMRTDKTPLLRSNAQGLVLYNFPADPGIATLTTDVQLAGYQNWRGILHTSGTRTDTIRLLSAVRDRDGDGIPDDLDKCADIAAPGTPDGCPVTVPTIADRDGDGTPDASDGCPEDRNKTASGTCGCGTPDTDRDGDGIPDCTDKCPDQPGPGTPDGCPVTPPAADVAAIIADLARNMIAIPGGTFTMGSDKKEKEAEDDEKPAHDVTLSAYSMGRTEVTNEQYCAFLNEKGNQEEGGRSWINLEGSSGSEKCQIQSADGKSFSVEKGYEKHPVIYVSWYGSAAFCKWLSDKTGKNYRLPTEAEWEYAARGGNLSKKYKYAGSNTLDEVAWYYNNSNSTTHPVGLKNANELGLYDMSGNVWEWCGDWYDSKYYEQFRSKAAVNPAGPTEGTSRVLRGGSWYLVSDICRVSLRVDYYPYDRSNNVGFRVAQDK